MGWFVFSQSKPLKECTRIQSQSKYGSSLRRNRALQYWKAIWLLASGMFVQWPGNCFYFRFSGLHRNDKLSCEWKRAKSKVLLLSLLSFVNMFSILLFWFNSSSFLPSQTQPRSLSSSTFQLPYTCCTIFLIYLLEFFNEHIKNIESEVGGRPQHVIIHFSGFCGIWFE